MTETFVSDPDRREKARAYAAIRRRLALINLGAAVVALGVWLFSGLAAWLAAVLPGPWPVAIALHLLVALVAYTLLTAPLSYFEGFVLPHRYGLSVQSLPSWLADQGKSAALGFVFALVIIEIVYLLLRVMPDWWWLIAAVVALALTTLLAALAPVLILPLFYKLTPLDDAGLVQRLMALADRAGTRLQGVYEIRFSDKSTAANAMLMGLGRTRRVALADTLVDRYTPEEIEVVLAHELAHHVHHDVPKGIAVSAALLLGGFWAADRLLALAAAAYGWTSIADSAGLPVLLAGLGFVGVLFGPVSNAFSRVWETAADRYALEATCNPGAFRTMLLKLADQNLAEIDPPRWVVILFYDHPSIASRLALGDGRKA